MRQVNFFIIFVIVLALVLFSIENTESVPIKIIHGVTVQAPLCIELIVAIGFGAVMAWVFSVWTQVQRIITVRREMGEREEQIANLEEDLERYKAALEEQRLLPTATSASLES